MFTSGQFRLSLCHDCEGGWNLVVHGPGNGAEKRPAARANIGRALLHTRAMVALASAPRAALATLVRDETSYL